MRIQLSRERDNIFKVPDSFIKKNLVRIMAIYENNTILNPDDYKFMGPRQIKMLKHINSESRVYAKILETKKGNQIISR